MSFLRKTILSCVCRYMYSGILQLKDDDLVQEAIAASDYFQMTVLKEALGLKYKYQVAPSNVFSWAKVADLYSMPQLKDMCDRIQLVKFKEVIKHEEFSGLSKDDVVEYFKRCKQYLGISNDDLMQASLTWMEANESFPQLLQEVDVKKCTPRALEDATNHPAMPPNVVTPIANCDDRNQEKHQTWVYLTSEDGVIVDTNDEMHVLFTYSPFVYDMSENTYRLCVTENGYTAIEQQSGPFDPLTRLTVFQYDATKQENTTSQELQVEESCFEFLAIHKSSIYMAHNHGPSDILVYDMKDNIWSKVQVPEESSARCWRAAVVGNGIFFLSSQLHLYCLCEGKLERIFSEFNKSSFEMDFFSITAVHRWLYIFAGVSEKSFNVHCYDTESGIWTDISLTRSRLEDWDQESSESSIMFENKIYFVGHACENSFFPDLYEYSLCDDYFKETTRTHPQSCRFRVVVADVAVEMLKEGSDAAIFSD